MAYLDFLLDRLDPIVMRHHVRAFYPAVDKRCRALGLGFADIGRPEKELSVEVRDVDGVHIDHVNVPKPHLVPRAGGMGKGIRARTEPLRREQLVPKRVRGATAGTPDLKSLYGRPNHRTRSNAASAELGGAVRSKTAGLRFQKDSPVERIWRAKPRTPATEMPGAVPKPETLLARSPRRDLTPLSRPGTWSGAVCSETS